MSRSKHYDPDEEEDLPVRDTERREARRLKRTRVEGEKENRREPDRSE